MRLNESASSGWLLRAVSCGGCAVVALWGLSVLLASMLGPLRMVGISQSCASNLKNVTRGFQMYADDYDDYYPIARRWMPGVSPYLDRADRLRCPAVSKPGEPEVGYAMNSRLEKPRRMIAEPRHTEVVFDSSTLKANANDPVSSLPRPGRHRGRSQARGPFRPGNNIGYMDGSVKMRFDEPSDSPPKK